MHASPPPVASVRRSPPSAPHRRSPRRRVALFATAAVLASTALAIPCGPTDKAAAEVIQPPIGPGTNWQLVAHEDFTTPLTTDDAPWVHDTYGPDSPWHVDELDDDGSFFTTSGGENFTKALNSFDQYRKSVPFGENGWLTAEYSARDYDKDGIVDAPPSLTNTTLPDGSTAAYLDEPAHDTGLIVTSTNALPPQYRIEYTLNALNFGGQRDGTWDYDNKHNGYDDTSVAPGGCTTNFPWVRGRTYTEAGAADPCSSLYGDVTGANGYYYLSIMDYPKPSPHNNIFIHLHRKVGMDLYTVSNPGESKSYKTCDPTTGEYYGQDGPKSTGNAVNALFFQGDKFKPGTMPYNEFIIDTECGFRNQDIYSAAEIQPELMPNESYTFAIERTNTSYTMEMSGNFLYLGQATLRYTRDFVQADGSYPIWHYNNTPEQYDGRYNRDLVTNTGPGGNFVMNDVWPAGSAYPDNFIIGDPHTNFYEGNATFSDIKLYVPTPVSVTPVLTPQTPNGDNGWYRSPVAVDFTVAGARSDEAIVETSLDGVTWTEHTAPLTLTADGTSVVHYRASLDGEVVATGTQAVKIDQSPPSTKLTPDSIVTGSGASASFLATDATSGVAKIEYLIPGNAWRTWDGNPLTFAQWKSKLVNMQFRATDVAGNVESVQSVPPGCYRPGTGPARCAE